ncbi:MAG: hypothetical protein OEL20_12650 [Sulfuritalea sp.]|nr:hypothetical protein [Sulfuritalea sp.]
MTLEFLTFIVGALAGILTGLGALAAYYAATRQNRLTATSIAADWLRDLRAWASEAVDVLAESTYMCRRSDSTLSSSEQAIATRCRYRLSALIDRGRFLLPNEREGEHGDHKASAYKGYRHPALDALVAAERILDGAIDLFAFPDRKAALIGVQREFVSIVQAILDPRSMNKTVAAILRHAQEDRRKDPSFGGLLPDPSKTPEGDEGLLYTASLRYEEATKR